MGKNKNDWGLSEAELERLDDAVADGIISRNEVMANKENLKKGTITVSELIDIWSSDDD